MTIYGKLTTSALDGFEEWRKKYYKYLYHCKKCAKNFETVEKEEKCKFCGEKIIELERNDVEMHRGKHRLSYYCYECKERFQAKDIIHNCEKCGSQVIQHYPFSAIRRRDRFILGMNFKIDDLKKVKIRGRKKKKKESKTIKNSFNKAGKHFRKFNNPLKELNNPFNKFRFQKKIKEEKTSDL